MFFYGARDRGMNFNRLGYEGGRPASLCFALWVSLCPSSFVARPRVGGLPEMSLARVWGHKC